ncbi:MAG: acyl-CoA desaturase [Chloroflexota bacterium]|nr:acyl-CoA desaturase [Chloroflexota bacterium]
MKDVSSLSPVMRPKSALAQFLTLVVVVVPLLATIYAIVTLWQREVTGTDLVLMLVLYLITGFGITIGFHRFATHRSFQGGPVIEFILLAAGSMAVEGPVLQWVADHWKHHKFSDRPGDPHSPLEGLFHAHVGWMFGKERGIPEADAKHLLKDPIARFMSSTFLFWATAGIAFPYLIDGWRGVLWGGLVRVFITHHITWSVNSICHQFGKRAFETPDQSGNQWVVGLIGLGEGWHNNHHAFPESAFHGLKPSQVDLSGYMIWFMERIRVIHSVRRVSAERLAKRKIA